MLIGNQSIWVRIRFKSSQIRSDWLGIITFMYHTTHEHNIGLLVSDDLWIWCFAWFIFEAKTKREGARWKSVLWYMSNIMSGLIIYVPCYQLAMLCKFCYECFNIMPWGLHARWKACKNKLIVGNKGSSIGQKERDWEEKNAIVSVRNWQLANMCCF